METTHAVVIIESCCLHFESVLVVGTEMKCLDARDDYNEARDKDDVFEAIVVRIGPR